MRWIWIFGALATGCISTVQVGTYTLRQSWWDKDAAMLRARASFELSCPSGQLELTVLATRDEGDARSALQVGVLGCGHKLVYVQRNAAAWEAPDWVLNSSDAQPEPRSTPRTN